VPRQKCNRSIRDCYISLRKLVSYSALFATGHETGSFLMEVLLIAFGLHCVRLTLGWENTSSRGSLQGKVLSSRYSPDD